MMVYSTSYVLYEQLRKKSKIAPPYLGRNSGAADLGASIRFANECIRMMSWNIEHVETL